MSVSLPYASILFSVLQVIRHQADTGGAELRPMSLLRNRLQVRSIPGSVFFFLFDITVSFPVIFLQCPNIN